MNFTKNSILIIIAIVFVGGLFSVAYAGPIINTITLAGNVLVSGDLSVLGTITSQNSFPPDGTDSVSVIALIQLQPGLTGPLVPVELFGVDTLVRRTTVTDPASGQRTVETEILSMELSGFHPSVGDVTLRAGSGFGLPATLGSVVPLGTPDFPATASFDVFFEVEVLGRTLHNDVALPVQNRPGDDVRTLPAIDVRLPTALACFGELLDSANTPSGIGYCATVFLQTTASHVVMKKEIKRIENRVELLASPPFPPSSSVTLHTIALVEIVPFGSGPQVEIPLTGRIEVLSLDPLVNPVTGQRSIQTEILSMDLRGIDPVFGDVTLRAGTGFGLPATLGGVTPLVLGSDFPAQAFFDVFFEVDIPFVGPPLTNPIPLRIEGVIQEIPPKATELRSQPGAPCQPLVDAVTGQPTPHLFCGAIHIVATPAEMEIKREINRIEALVGFGGLE